MQITNPILPGFNADPSILRVGDDYSIATSTFEWFPGPELDMTIISDEMGPGWGFTGSFFGLCCQDQSGRARPADFDWFAYREID